MSQNTESKIHSNHAVENARSLADIIFGVLDIGAAALDAQGRYVSVNSTWKTAMGIDDDVPLIGQSHFDTCQSFLEVGDIAAVISGETITNQPVNLALGDGDARLFNWGASAVENHPDLADQETLILATVRPAETSDQRTEQLLRERDQLRFALDGADYGLWDWNVVTGEVFFSRKYMDMLGYGQFELPHAYDTWSYFCKPEDVVEYQEAITDYIEVGEGFLEDEFEMRCKDGSYIWILSRGKIVSRRPDGSPLRIVGTHQDISALKAREAQLVAARDEANRANQAKSNFIALISHEVRTPLNAITSVLQLLGDEADEDERKRLAQVALNSSDQLLTVLSDVLDVSKMEAGRFDLNPRPVQISTLVEELSQTQKRAIEAKGLTFDLNITGSNDLTLMMDPVRVSQILNNYLSNAAKFTEEGAVVLSLEVDEAYGSEDQVFLSFSVRDDGVGLSPGERDKLFQPFYQAEGTRNRSAEGTGLGLSICKSLAALMGGKVWCASKKGRGSTFHFEAVFTRANQTSMQDRANNREGVNAKADCIRVLAAEDNPVNQHMLKKFLIDRFGYDLTIVNNGQQALEALAQNMFDVVLMDIHMPVMDGVTATKKVRESGEGWCNLPIIALTADASDEHVAEYRTAGVSDCAAKPVDWRLLDTLIQKWGGKPDQTNH